MLCFTVLASGQCIETVADLDDLEAVVGTAWTNSSQAKTIPPGDFDYDNRLGVIAYELGFSTNFLISLVGVTNANGTNTFVLYPVEVIETTNGADRVRTYLSAVATNPAVVYTTTVSIAQYPEAWIEDAYGEAPEWLGGGDLQAWYDDRDPWRQRISFDLIATSSIPDYIAMLTNAVGYYSDGTNTNSLLVIYSNDIAFVEAARGSGGIDLYLHAPTNVPTVDVFMSTNLLETYGWTLRATLDHRVDPILWTHSSSDVLGFLSAGDATVDVDGDGLPDSRELRMFGTSTNLTDTDGDGLSDGAEIQTYGLHALSADTDGDDLPDGWEVSYGLDALSSAGQDGLYGDPDADGLVNLKECQLGTSPTNGADPAATDIMVLDYDPENGSLSVEWDSADTYDSYGYALYTQGDELNDPIQSDNGMERPEVEFDELPEDPSGYTLEVYAYEGATTNSVAAFAATNFLSLWCPIASITAEVNAETRATSTATSEGTAPTAYVCTSETAMVQLTAHEAQGAFPSGAPRWSTGESSTSTIDAPVGEEGTVSNYWAEWGDTRIYINVAIIKVDIERDGTNISWSTNGVNVGEHIALTGTIEPDLTVLSNRWSVPGTRIKSYTMSDTLGETNALSDTGLSATNVAFYWIDDGSSLEVEYTVYAEEATCSASAWFTVDRPTASLTSVTTTNSPAVDVSTNYWTGEETNYWLHFGNESSPGITWTGLVATAAGGTGEIAFVQLIREDDRCVESDGTAWVLTSSNKFVLDSTAPDVLYEDSPYSHKSIGNSDAEYIDSNDTPGINLDTPGYDFISATADNDFKVYLMYRPAGVDSIWVTLRKMEWQWSGTATNNAGWSMLPGSSSSSSPSGIDSIELPIWDNHAENITFEEE